MSTFFKGFFTTIAFATILVLVLATTFIIVSFVASSGGSIPGS